MTLMIFFRDLSPRLSCLPAALSVQCRQNNQDVLHGYLEHAWSRKANKSKILDQQYIRSVVLNIHPVCRSNWRVVAEIYGDPEVHPQPED